MGRFLLFMGPLLAILINLLAITHLRYEKPGNELICTFRLKWQNWAVVGICTVVFFIFASYLLIENL